MKKNGTRRQWYPINEKSKFGNQTTKATKLNIPDDPEIVAIKVPWLKNIFIVFQNYFYKGVICSRCNRSSHVGSISWREVLDAVETKHSRYFKMIGQLQWCVWIDVGDAIDCIPLLAVNSRCRVGKDNCSWRYYLAIVERSLRVRPSCAGCQVPSVKKIRKISTLQKLRSILISTTDP